MTTVVPDLFERRRVTTVEDDAAARQVVVRSWWRVHLIEQYARHNGHADLLRDAVGGTAGE